MESLTFLYPAWYLLLCLLLGAGFAALLYFRDKTFSDQPLWLRILLAGLRFTAVTAIAALLLQPVLKHQKTEIQQAYIALLADNSQSVPAHGDSSAVQELYGRLQQLREQLSNEAEVDVIYFGEEEIESGEQPTFDDRYTDISSAYEYVYQNYSGLNLGAVVLVSDGIYNRGRNPLYLNRQIKAPLHVVPLGDTSQSRDIGLRNVFYNDIMYLGDKVEIQLDLEAFNLEGEGTVVRLYDYSGESRQVVASESVNFERDNVFRTLSFIAQPDRAGVLRYQLVASPAENEENTRNNVRDIYLEVLDSRSKILLLADAPHPDLNALKELLTLRGRKEVEIHYADEFDGALEAYDLAVLHQIPGSDNAGNLLLNRIQNSDLPIWYILGSGSNIGAFNANQEVLEIMGDHSQINEVEAYVNPEFSLFTLSEETEQFIPTFPPLLAPFGEYRVQGGMQTLLQQKIGDVKTQHPLLVLGEVDGRKIGVLTGEGIWRWKLFNYLQQENFEQLAGLLEKSVQYLSLKEDRRRFRVYLQKNIFDENENVVFRAELYNKSYELVNEPDVSLTLIDEDEQEYNYSFDKLRESYKLDAGSFADGNYRYIARTQFEGEEFSQSGSFSVKPVQLELYRSTADHNLLRLLAQKHGGEVISPGNTGSLEQLLRSGDALKPVYYSRTQNSSVLQLEWVLAILLLLLSVEWFIRKYLGAY